MRGEWKLKRTAQCAKCPWRVDVDPREIPNGYDVERHKALASTIADPNNVDVEAIMHALTTGERRVMACHETEGAYCVGWVMNQVGDGGNVLLRMDLRTCTNAHKLRTVGPQHARFEDTLPR